MIQNYVNKLIENLPEELKNKQKIQHLDLVLSGGAFNGSYLIGSLYFLKEMERNGYVKIERISTCSIGSIVSLFFLIDKLDDLQVIYKYVIQQFKENYDLSVIKHIKTIFNDIIPLNICELVNHKLYICYNNVKKCKKIVKTKFASKDELIDTIIKSCFLPIIVDGNLTYKGKYIDGINPYIFSNKNNKNNKNKKILYIDVFTFDKFSMMLNIKNEKNNFHRLLTGLLEIHTFFIKNSHTQMCSYVSKWNIKEKCASHFKGIVEKLILYSICFILYIRKIIVFNIENTVLCKVFYKLIKEFYIAFLDTHIF
jgi:hypothetical protein